MDTKGHKQKIYMSTLNEIQDLRKLYPAEANRLDIAHVANHMYRSSNFEDYLRCLFSPDIAEKLRDLYCLGATTTGGTLFWQIDYCGQVRTAKIIWYEPYCSERFGHRVKNDKHRGATWAHSIMKRDGILPKDFQLDQCLFGEHLTHLYPHKPVAVLESEKSALICSAIYPRFVWLAVGGQSNFTKERCKCLWNKDVLIFPDCDVTGETYAKWDKTVHSLKHWCKRIRISNVLERFATVEEKQSKIDICDWLLKRFNPHGIWCEQPRYDGILMEY